MFKKYKYRFKTREEFINEFGDNWRNKVYCGFVSEMDNLLGEDIEKKYYNQIDDIIIKNRLLGTIHYQSTDPLYGCSVSLDMIKKVILTPEYKPRKFVY
jgi:hypothetical protein